MAGGGDMAGVGAGADMAGAPPKDGIGGAAMGGIAGIGGAAIGAGARPAGGVGAVKLLGAWAASRGSSAPQPRQNL